MRNAGFCYVYDVLRVVLGEFHECTVLKTKLEAWWWRIAEIKSGGIVVRWWFGRWWSGKKSWRRAAFLTKAALIERHVIIRWQIDNKGFFVTAKKVQKMKTSYFENHRHKSLKQKPQTKPDPQLLWSQYISGHYGIYHFFHGFAFLSGVHCDFSDSISRYVTRPRVIQGRGFTHTLKFLLNSFFFFSFFFPPSLFSFFFLSLFFDLSLEPRHTLDKVDKVSIDILSKEWSYAMGVSGLERWFFFGW